VSEVILDGLRQLRNQGRGLIEDWPASHHHACPRSGSKSICTRSNQHNAVSNIEESKRLVLDLGGSKLARRPDQVPPFRVFADPAGQPFCLEHLASPARVTHSAASGSQPFRYWLTCTRNPALLGTAAAQISPMFWVSVRSGRIEARRPGADLLRGDVWVLPVAWLVVAL
jgi:hypothetical protein